MAASQMKLLTVLLAAVTVALVLIDLTSEMGPQAVQTTELVPDDKEVKNGNTRFVLKPAAPGTLNIHVYPNKDKKNAVVQMVKDLAMRVQELSKYLTKLRSVRLRLPLARVVSPHRCFNYCQVESARSQIVRILLALAVDPGSGAARSKRRQGRARCAWCARTCRSRWEQG